MQENVSAHSKTGSNIFVTHHMTGSSVTACK